MKPSKQRIQDAINHRVSDKLPVDFGSTAVTGMHCRIVEQLRRHYGLEERPVKIVDAFQMLGEVDQELGAIIGTDCVGIGGPTDIFGHNVARYHEQTTPWGQHVLVPEGLDLAPDAKGDIYVWAGGDRAYPPSAVMPEGCFFVNAIERQPPIEEDKLNPEDNLEEFGLLSDADLKHYARVTTEAAATGKAVVASFGGTALGDVAFIPAMNLPSPRGIRSVVEWYLSTALRPDYVHKMFERQTDIAIENYRLLWDLIGDKVDVVFTCGTDFGTQDSQFCSPETFDELWTPYYRRLNDWIHANTSWKVMKHCCGSIVPLLPNMIKAGFDIINPVQINAAGMDSKMLKERFGKDLTFWGGGIDTQKILPYGTPAEIRDHVKSQCEILEKDGGFVFNAVHNIQANVPVENVVAMIETIRELRK